MKRFSMLLILALLAMMPVWAQTNTGAFRITNTSVIDNVAHCFELTPGAGPNFCILNNAANQIEFTQGDQATQASLLNLLLSPAAQPAAASPVAGVTALSATGGTGGAQSATTGNGANGGPETIVGGVGGLGGSSSGTAGTGGKFTGDGGAGGAGPVTGGAGGPWEGLAGNGGNGSGAGGTGGAWVGGSGAAGTGGTGTVGTLALKQGATNVLNCTTAQACTLASGGTNQNLALNPSGTGVISPGANGYGAATGGGAGSGIVMFADTGNPAAGSTGTNTTGVAHQLWYTTIYVPHSFTVSNVAVLSGGTATTDKIAIGIWSLSGTLLACTATTDAGGTTLSGANTWQKLALSASCPNGATTFVVAGGTHYIVGVVTTGTNAGDIQTYPLANGPWASSASAQGTLANFTPAVTQTASTAPYIMLQ